MSLATVVAAIFEKYADRPALGSRVTRIVDEQAGGRCLYLEPRFETQTYAQLWARTGRVASALHHHATAPVSVGDSVAMLSFTNADYAALDISCIRLGAVTVPLQAGASLPELIAILDETRPTLLASSIEQLPTAIACIARCPWIQRLIVLDVAQQSSAQVLSVQQATAELRKGGHSIDICSFHELVATGAALPEVCLDVRPGSADTLAMLIYTSGSTGTPKGAMYTQRLAAGMWGGTWATIFSDVQAHTFHYMPMSHVAGHSSLKSTLARGGTCFFTAQANLSTLLEDIALVQPTELSLVPRVCEMIYQKYQAELARNHAADGDAQSLAIIQRMRTQAMGGCVAWASCSSAPIGAQLKGFIERLLGVALHDVYGSTEAGAVWLDNQLLRPPVQDYKLRDVPELGYYLTDRPHPRGELMLKTDSIIGGYYKRPEANNELFDAAGYYRTGDIVAEHEGNRLHIVDRRKNVVKLSQGEFVALARLETLFNTIPDLDSIFVHANSNWAFPLAVIVPNERLLARLGGDEADVRAHLIASLRSAAWEAGLRSFEIPRDFILASQPFSQNNGLLSDHGKPLWPRLRQRYEAQLDALHAHIKSTESSLLHDVQQLAGDRPAIEVVLQAAQSLLGTTAEGISPTMQFRDLGGDSLSAVTMAQLLSEAFGVALPVDVIISPAYDLQHVADYIEAKISSGLVRPTAAQVHGENATAFRAADLTLGSFLPPQLLAQAGPRFLPPGPETILLTGATGFLGRFLCLEILERIDRGGGKLICIVRGKSSRAARARLLDAYGGASSALGKRFLQLEPGLEVVAGDMGEERLGLDQTTWARLAATIDRIVHCGALVNHLLSYASLFDANVNGTAELIGLALTHHLKPISFMSSIAVATLQGVQPVQPLDEDQDIRQWGAVISAEDTYAAGYGLTKWAGEVLLREAHEQFGLPVTVYRSSMILAHSHEPGQLNVPDMFTRLLLSIAATGLAPRSFYQVQPGESATGAHYDGLPVDFSTAAIINTSLVRRPEGYRSFNLVNHHDDGISLDSVVEWMRGNGVAIRTIDDYAQWLERFEQALRQLPERLKAQSMLPLLSSVASPSPVQAGSALPSNRFQDALRQAGAGEVAQVSEALVQRYLIDLKALGLREGGQETDA